jgi:hypothetical protein
MRKEGAIPAPRLVVPGAHEYAPLDDHHPYGDESMVA